jgi:hypothetical protein
MPPPQPNDPCTNPAQPGKFWAVAHLHVSAVDIERMRNDQTAIPATTENGDLVALNPGLEAMVRTALMSLLGLNPMDRMRSDYQPPDDYGITIDRGWVSLREFDRERNVYAAMPPQPEWGVED